LDAWGPEALKKAKDENKLIIVSIGYSACHWCHVMERESFENSAIAQTMNTFSYRSKSTVKNAPILINACLCATDQCRAGH
jgi:thioredoxin-related protein